MKNNNKCLANNIGFFFIIIKYFDFQISGFLSKVSFSTKSRSGVILVYTYKTVHWLTIDSIYSNAAIINQLSPWLHN